MNSKSDYLIDLIYKKLRSYKNREIFLEKKILKKFISSLIKENWTKEQYNDNCYSCNNFVEKLCIVSHL